MATIWPLNGYYMATKWLYGYYMATNYEKEQLLIQLKASMIIFVKKGIDKALSTQNHEGPLF